MKRSVDHKAKLSSEPLIDMQAVEIERMHLEGAIRWVGGVDRRKMWANILKPKRVGEVLMMEHRAIIQKWDIGGSHLMPYTIDPRTNERID